MHSIHSVSECGNLYPKCQLDTVAYLRRKHYNEFEPGNSRMISYLYIKNFRSIKELEIFPEHLCALLGPNSVGKTNILKALDTEKESVCNHWLNLAKIRLGALEKAWSGR